MDLFGANPVDVVVLVVIVVSALLALVRGFVAEVLAIVAWVTAIAVTAYGTQPALPMVEQYMGPGLTSMATTVGGLFFGTLAIMSALSFAASRSMRNNHLSAVDRSLGLMFGVARGGMLVVLIYICVVFVFPLPQPGEEAEPNTMQEILLEARLQPALASGAEILQAVAPEDAFAIDQFTQPPASSDEDASEEGGGEQEDNQPQGSNMSAYGTLSLGTLAGELSGLKTSRE